MKLEHSHRSKESDQKKNKYDLKVKNPRLYYLDHTLFMLKGRGPIIGIESVKGVQNRSGPVQMAYTFLF